MLDIDHFKNINDTYGHDIGDIVIKNLGTIIKDAIRESDSAVRYGGEEIVIIFPSTDADHASFLAERLRKEIEESVIFPADAQKDIPDIRITVSIGIAECTPLMSSAEELIKHADMAMYQAKKEGRNHVVLYDKTSK